MPIDVQIRRDRSALADGTLFGRKKRGIAFWKIGLWLIAMGFVGVVIWQFNTIQPQVLAMVGSAATATPSAVAYAQQGDQAFWRGDLATAIANYRQAVKQAPTNIDFRYELVRMLVYHSYEDRRNTKDISNSRPDANNKETLPIDQQGALQIAEQAAIDNPNNARAFSIDCFARMAAGKDEDGIRACLHALDLNPNDAETYAFEAYALNDLARFDAALDAGAKAVNLNNQSIDANTSYAQALWYKGRFNQALIAYKNAADINPHLEFPYFNLAFFAMSQDNVELAVEVYNKVLSMNAHSVKAYTRLCAAYERAGQFPNARDNCEQALTIDGNYPDAVGLDGEVLYRSRDYEDAETVLKHCTDLESDLYNQDPSFQRNEKCWLYLGLAKFTLDKCSNDPDKKEDGAVKILSDLLGWATTDSVIRLANDGINRCATAYQGLYSTPTPRPPTPEPPTPILLDNG